MQPARLVRRQVCLLKRLVTRPPVTAHPPVNLSCYTAAWLACGCLAGWPPPPPRVHAPARDCAWHVRPPSGLQDGCSRCCHASVAALPCLNSCLAVLKQGVAQGTAKRSPGSRVAGVRMQAGVHGAQAPASTTWFAAACTPLSMLPQAWCLTSPSPAAGRRHAAQRATLQLQTHLASSA